MIDKIFKPDWAKAINKHYSSDKFSLLGSKIAQLRRQVKVYPEKDEVFRAFELTSYNETKVVIIGQDLLLCW